jgi:hypothetical protein
MPKPRFYLESQESSSPIITRAVSAGLRGQYSDTYNFPIWQRIALSFLGLFPQNLSRLVISRFESLKGLNPEVLDGFNIRMLTKERIEDYASLSGQFKCITLGAALGGATAHLSLALGGPFLPQAFVVTLRGGSPDGSPMVYFNRSANLALKIAQNNPNLLTIQHYDPIHDEWMTRYVNHLRFKLIGLPEEYKNFIRRYLEPGGAICYLDCKAEWLRYKVGERSVFQVGGWGDVKPEEYLQGSERIERYCKTIGLKNNDWRLTGFQLEKGSESEWGSESGLDEALSIFCNQEGYRFIQISLPEPHDFSYLAYLAYDNLIELGGCESAGVCIEMFTQFDATAVIKGSLLPLWLVFNTRDSMEFLKTMLPKFPPNKPVYFSPLSTFTITPDITPWHEWAEALKGLDWFNIGTRPDHYPADARTLVNWSKLLRKRVAQHEQFKQQVLNPEELYQIALQINQQP